MQSGRMPKYVILLSALIVGSGCQAPEAMPFEPIPDARLASPHPEADADSAAARGDRRLLVAFFGWGPVVPNWQVNRIAAWRKAYGLRYVLVEGDVIPRRTPAGADTERTHERTILDYIARYDDHLQAALQRAGWPAPAR